MFFDSNIYRAIRISQNWDLIEITHDSLMLLLRWSSWSEKKFLTMERDTSHNISFQVSYTIFSLYLTKLIFYQNAKRNFNVFKSMGHFVVQDSFSYSTCYHCMRMAMVPERPCGTATQAKENICKHNNAEEISQEEVSLDKVISSL